MGQIENLQENIEELTEVILSLNETVKPFDIAKYFMTPRQIAKKMMMVTSKNPDLKDQTGAEMPLDEKSVHIIVYGKYLEGADGKVVDDEIKHPECVDPDRAMSLSHPTFKEKIPNTKREVKNSFRMLNIKKTALKEEFTFAIKQIATGISVFAASSITIPIGSGIPAAISALQSVVKAINNLMASVLQIIPILGPLVDIPLLVAAAVLDSILIVVNTILMAIILVLTLIATLRKLIIPIMMIPGVG